MRLQLVCDVCSETVEEESRRDLGKQIQKTLSCGHVVTESLLRAKDPEDLEFDDGRIPFKHQVENLEFAHRSNFRFLCADDTGLGKTLTALGTLKLWKKSLLPAIVVCKPSLVAQWTQEIIGALGAEVIPWPLQGSKDIIPPAVKLLVVSYDTLARMKDIPEKFSHLRSVILDEVHQIKNLDAKRTKAVQELCAGKDYVQGYGATPFKNNLIEYYPILNLLDPGRFDRQSRFIDRFVATYWSNGVLKYGGLSEYAAPVFKDLIKDLVIRHERSEVMPDLPPILESQRFFDLSDAKKYEEAEKKFEDLYDELEREGFNQSNRLILSQSLMALKHAAGQQKIPYAIEMIRTFLEENPPNGEPPRKLTVFVHHRDVHSAIVDAVRDMCEEFDINPALEIRGDMDRMEKDRISGNCANFHWPSENPKDRVLIASTLSGGEGLNLQSCYDAILVERQWNPANERQAKGRFPRPGSTAKSGVFWNIMILLGSLDEDLVKINERKSSYDPNVTGEVSEGNWDESEFMMELAERIRERRKER